MEQEENKWKVKVDESQKTIKQVFKNKELRGKKIKGMCERFKKKKLRVVVLTVWALDEQRQHHVGTLFGPPQGLLSVKLWG